MRRTTKSRNRRVVDRFCKLLRSGKDYSTQYMYSEAGAVGFVSAKTAGNIVRKHYNAVITVDMVGFLDTLVENVYFERVKAFAEEFKLCIRESRLIIRYIQQ